MIKKSILVSLAVAAILFAIGEYYWYNISTTLHNPNSAILTIEKGEGINSIAHKLRTNGLISSENIFKLYLYLNNETSKIKAGKYEFSGRDSIIQVTQILKRGEGKSNTSRVKIIEGWNSKDINNYLFENNLIAKENFLSLANRKISDWQFNFPKPSFLADAAINANLEGYLFPDTYEIFNNSSGSELIKKMLGNMDVKLDKSIREDIGRQHKTIYEIMTLASIIQKEVKNSDMDIVSGIFWKRLKNGQRLESCATLAYALGVNKAQYSYEDTLVDSPYNTYRNNGLPPGPISNPGMNAIRAAAYPKDSNYLFFLSRPDTGETVFSSTLAEHNKNKVKYLK